MNRAIRFRHVSRQQGRLWFSVCAGLALLGLLSAAANAANFTYSSGVQNGNWGNNGLWLFGAVPPTNGSNTDIFLEGSDRSPDVQDNANNNVNYDIDSITLSSGYTGTGDLALSGGRLTIDNFIENEENGRQLEFNMTVRMGGLSGLSVRANDGEVDFDGAVDFRFNNQTLSVSGGNNVFFDGGITDSQNFITTATLSISGGTFVRLSDDSDVLTKVNITNGELLLNAASPLDSNVNVDVFSNGIFDLNDNNQNIDVLTGSGLVDLGSATLTFGESASSDASFTFSGIISGTGSITKNQSGETVLSGANTYSGATTVDNGTLRTDGSHRIGNASDIIVNGNGTFDINGFEETVESISGSGDIKLGTGGLLRVDQDGGSYTFSGNISESGELEKDGTATLILSGTNSFSLLDIDEGVVQVSSQSNMGSGSVQISGGTLNTTATFTSSLPISTNASGSTINVNNATALTQSGVISGSGELVKDGPGSLNLAANNTYTGDTIVNDGILRYTGSNRISNSSDVEMITGASIFLEGFTDTVNSLSGTGGLISTGGSSGRLTVDAGSGTFTWGGAFTGSGGLTKAGNHTMVITASQSFTGAALISDGTLEFSGSGSFSSSSDVNVSSGATWDLNGISDTVDSIVGAGTIRLDGATLTVDETVTNTRTFSGPIVGPGSLNKGGAHTLVLSGFNSFDGELSISDGTLQVSQGSNLGASATNIVFFGGTLHTTGTIVNARDIVIGPFNTATFDVNASTNHTLTGPISGDSTTTLFKNGDGTLGATANNAGTFSGDIVINAGTFSMGGGGDALGNSTTVTVNSPGTFQVNNPDDIGGLAGSGSVVLNQTLRVGHDNLSTTFSGVISGSATFGKRGTGIVTLSGSNTYTGLTDIDGGTLRLSGSGRIADASDVDVASGTTFDLNDVSDAIDALSNAGSVTLGTGNSSNTLTIGANNGSATFSGVISESGHLVKVGSGTQTLSGNNTYSGTTSFDGGTLSTASSSNLGTAPLSFGGGRWRVTGTFANGRSISIDNGIAGTIEVSVGQTLTQNGSISGVGSDLVKEGGGTLIYAGAANHSGDNVINGGVLRLAANHRINNASDVVVNAGGTFDLDGFFETVESISGAGNVTLGAGGTLQVDAIAGNFELSGVMSGAGDFVKLNGHVMTLSGANAHDSNTINGGILSISSNSNLGDPAGDLNIDGGTLRITDNVVDLGAARSITLGAGGGTIRINDEGGVAVNIPSIIAGVGGLTINADNEEFATLSGGNTYQGGTRVEDAVVSVSQNANLGANTGDVTLDNGILFTTASFTNQHALVLDGGGSIDVEVGALTQSAGISGTGNLHIGGPGIMILTEPATHAGNTTIASNGTLQFGSGELPDAFDVTVNGLWDLNGVSDEIGGLFGGGTVMLGGGTLTVGADDEDANFSGSIQENGSFVKIGPGTQILSGANTYLGSTTIEEGAIEITSDGSLGDASSTLSIIDGTLISTATFTTGRTTTIDHGAFDTAAGTTLTFTSPIGSAGSTPVLTKRGGGTLELTQPNTYDGGTTILEGTLLLTGAGQLPDASDVTIATGATLDMTDIDDAIDGLRGDGMINLGTGTLTIGADDGGSSFSGVITGTGIGGTIVKEGTGTQVFSGANTYAGGTEINGGTLEISQDANLGELGGQVTFDGGTLHTTADIPNMVREMTISAGNGTIEVEDGTTLGVGGNIAGVGELNKTGDGTLVLSGISSYDGTNVLGGVLSVGFNFNLGNSNGQLTVDGATLHTSNSFTTTRLTTIGAGGATFDVDEVLPGVDHTHNGVIQGNGGANPFAKTGLGEMRLTGVNTFSAPIHINAGRLSVSASNQLGNTSNTIAFGGGTWFVDGTFSNPRVVQLNQNGGTIDVAGGFTLTQTAVIEDGANAPAGPLNKSGAGDLQLDAANTYTSATNIQSGRLRLSNAGRLPDTSDVDVAAGATFDLNNISDAVNGLSGGGDITLGSGQLTIGANDGGATFSGTISGTGALVKVGTGTQLLRLNEVGEDTFPNTYTGGTQINGGILDIELDNNLGDPAGPLSFDGGTLQVAGDNSVTTTRLATLNAGGGTVNTVGEDSAVTFAGVIDGLGFLRKNGQGTVTLEADNTYTGDTIILNGRLRLSNAGRIPDASYVTVEASGIMNEGLDLNNISDTIRGLEGNGDVHLGTATLTVGASGGDFSGTIDGAGGLEKIGAGNLILAGVNTYDGGTAINGGSIEIDADNRLGDVAGPLSFDGGTLFTLGTFSTSRATTMNASGGTFDVPGSNTFTHNGNIVGVGGLGKAGAGTLLLTAVSSYGGGTTVADGTLQLAGSERLPNTTSLTVSAPGVFNLNNFNESIDGLAGNGSVDLTNAQLTVGIAGGGGSFSGVISGTGDFQKEGAGTQTLAGGAHTFSGATVVNGGQLILNGGGSIDQTTLSVGFNNGSNGTTTVTDAGTTWDVGGNLTVGAQGIGRLNIDSSAAMTVGGQLIIGAGLGEGTLLVDGGTLDNSTGTGILVQEGTLGGSGDILGSVINQDIVAPGTSAGVLNLTGTFVQEITGTFAAEIGGTGAGQFDVLNVSGTASLAGDLELSLLGFAPAPGDAFAILVAGTLVGEFGNVADGARLNILAGGTGSFQVDYDATSVVLSDFSGTADTLPGDFNNDDFVNGFDFLVWQRGGSPNGATPLDLGAWEGNYGSSVPAAAASGAVPEPSTLLLLLIGTLAVKGRRTNRT
ncbi:autotransporter-associated beta strand repeat-containing protein [Pirellulales bacterium]|nr:autotransporter-associated beta strand repeat-containing protein [Pirellulales bacterium]